MEKSKIIHLEKANTLTNFLSKREREEIISLKVTGVIGLKDFEDVLDEMCYAGGKYDEYDNFIPDFDITPALRHLDLGEATYVDGEDLPYFGSHAQLESFVLPQGVKTTLYGIETETGLNDTDMLKTLILPKSIKTVGGFNSCTNLTELILPKGLEEIRSFAFCGCEAIKSIRIPASVKVIDGSCFAGCSIERYEVDGDNPYFTTVDGAIYTKDLDTLVAFPSAYPNKEFVVLDNTKIIGDSAFMDSQIESIKLPDSLISIEGWAFQGSSIRSIEMPDSITKVGELAFRWCFQLEKISLSNGLTQIPRQLFSSCPKLKELDVPPNVKTISYSAIAWCDGLENLYLHDGLGEIVDEGPMLGSYGKLQKVVLPKTLKKVPGGVFNYSPYLVEFKLDPANPFFSVIDGALCSKDGKTLHSVPDYNRTTYQVPEGIEVIAAHVFAFLPLLQSIKLPSTLKVIKSRAFQGCKSLYQLDIPAGVKKIDIDALWADNLKTIVMEGSVPPEMTGNVKDEDWRYKNVVLCVPRGTISVYKNAPGWKCFNVKETNE